MRVKAYPEEKGASSLHFSKGPISVGYKGSSSGVTTPVVMSPLKSRHLGFWAKTYTLNKGK